MILVDTTIWSLALRRRRRDLSPLESSLVTEWIDLVRTGRAALTGPVRQEVLSGIRDVEAFRAIRSRLSDFPHLNIASDDYDRAVEFFNTCRRTGVSGSAMDFLICAVASRHGVPIFTTDPDFARYRSHVGVRLHRPPDSASRSG